MKGQEKTGYPSIDKPWLKNYPDGAYNNVITGIDMRAYDFLYCRVKEYLDLPAIEYFGAKITYANLFSCIEQWAKAFSSYGIKKGDFVSICLPNIPELIFCFYALNRVGAIANFIDPRAASREIKTRIARTHSKLLIVIENICAEKIIPISDDIAADCIVVSPTSSFGYGNFSFSAERTFVQFAHFLKHAKVNKPFIKAADFMKMGANASPDFDVPFTPRRPVSALYTSGTTADTMSACLFANENYNAMIKNMSYGSSYIKPGKRFLGVIPLFVAYGSFNGMHNALCNAWTIIMIPVFKPQLFASLIVKHKVNAALGVPKFWEQFIALDHCDLSSLEIPVCGGDWISPAQIKRINTAFQLFHAKQNLKIGYGATEFGGCVTVTSDDNDKYNPNSVGTFLPGNTAMIFDSETQAELPYDQEGELCISSPTMMLEYFGEPEKTASITVQKEGVTYYRTGDKAKITSKGELIFCDRYKRVMIRPDGHTVSCSLIENVMISHPAVQNCAVVGLKVSSDKSGVIPTAFVVLNDTEKPSQNMALELDKHCSATLGERDKALAITFISRLPYTPIGKINFRQLELYTFGSAQFHIIDTVFFET